MGFASRNRIASLAPFNPYSGASYKDKLILTKTLTYNSPDWGVYNTLNICRIYFSIGFPMSGRLAWGSPRPEVEAGMNFLEVKDLRIHFFTCRGIVKEVDGVTFSLKESDWVLWENQDAVRAEILDLLLFH